MRSSQPGILLPQVSLKLYARWRVPYPRLDHISSTMVSMYLPGASPRRRLGQQPECWGVV